MAIIQTCFFNKKKERKKNMETKTLATETTETTETTAPAVVTCAACGDTISRDDAIEHDGDYYCEDCYHIRYTICADCGHTISRDDVILGPDGRDYCDDCYNDRYTTCDACGETISRDDAIEHDGDDYCDDCYNDRYTECEDCGHTIRRSSAIEHYGDYYCYDCFNDRYVVCGGCHDVVDRDDAIAHDGDYYCESCAPCRDEDGFIHDARYRPREYHRIYNIKRGETAATPAIGLEIEIEHGDNGDVEHECTAAAIYAIARGETYAKHDGSLTNGVEIVTHPHTPAALIRTGILRRILVELFDRGYTSYSGGNCGAHCHVSRQSAACPDGLSLRHVALIRRVILTSGRDYQAINRRSNADRRQWAASVGDDAGILSDYINNANHHQATRYSALNVTSDTIEFRMPRGTLRYESARNQIRLTLALVDYARQCSSWQSATWSHFRAWLTRSQYYTLSAWIDERRKWSIPD